VADVFVMVSDNQTNHKPMTEPIHNRAQKFLGGEKLNSFLHPITGKVMVWVPAGEFLYGDNKQTISLDEYWIDKVPVTNAEYKQFLDANPQHSVPRVIWGVVGLAFGHGKYQWDKQSRMYPKGKADHPVVLVSWHDAQAYAAWAKAELPSEQQWEKAARGIDGRIYPWGDDWRNNYCNTKESRIGGITPVGQYSPHGDSPFGCVDMSGNVWEWTSSLWEPESDRPVIRGGSGADPKNYAGTASRYFNLPANRSHYFGFRVVMRHLPS
jgi:formylglycine-generating enzyme required for sulfatase activity